MFNQVGLTMNGAHAPPSEDRYAALKDLDSLMKQTQLKEETTGMQSTWNANNTNGKYYLSNKIKPQSKVSINYRRSFLC